MVYTNVNITGLIPVVTVYAALIRHNSSSHARVLVSLCVRLSVCHTPVWYHNGKRRIMQTTSRDSPGTLVFWCQQWLVGDPLLLKFSLTVTYPLSNTTISTNIRSIAPQPWKLAKNVHLALTGSRPRAFQQRAIDEPCTLPLTPQRVAQNAILLFLAVKLKNCRQKSATKFLCVKTSSSNVVVTSILYLTVHRWIADDVPIYLKFALEVTHPCRKRRFQHRLIVPEPWELAKKSPIITNRKSTMRFPLSHRWILCVTPKSPKGGSNSGWWATPFFENFYLWRSLSFLSCR